MTQFVHKQGYEGAQVSEQRMRNPELYRGVLDCAYNMHIFPETGGFFKKCQRCEAVYLRFEEALAALSDIKTVGVVSEQTADATGPLGRRRREAGRRPHRSRRVRRHR